MPQGLKIINRDYVTLCYSAWTVGVYYEDEDDQCDDKEDEESQNSDESDNE